MKNPIKDYDRECLLVDALEGGSNYWYFLEDDSIKAINEKIPQDKETPLSIRMFKAIVSGADVPVYDCETNEKLGSISLKSIKKGESTMVTKYPFHFSAIIKENYDATTADVWFQLAVMNDVIYG